MRSAPESRCARSITTPTLDSAKRVFCWKAHSRSRKNRPRKSVRSSTKSCSNAGAKTKTGTEHNRTHTEYSRAEEAAAFLRNKTKLRPKIALVLGSGLGSFADQLTGAVHIPYHEIPHFPRPTAEGHAGQLVIGTLGHASTPCLKCG